MKSKDLKNSNEELSITPQEPTTVELQEAQPTTDEIQPIEEQPVETATEVVTETEQVKEVIPKVARKKKSEPVATEVKKVARKKSEKEKPVEKEKKVRKVKAEMPEKTVVEAIEPVVVEETEVLVFEEPTLVVETIPLAEKVDIAFELEEEKKPSRESVDYSGKTEIELINILRGMLEDGCDYDDVREDVDNIKFQFYKIHHAQIEQKKNEYIAEHGNDEDFLEEESPYETDLKNLLDRFRMVKVEHNKKVEEEKETNLAKKYQIIEDIKALINNKESINKTFHDFRELQNDWREIGLVPQTKLKDLWDTYHHHVENFYDYIKINKELRDLDLKKNLEAKMELCEKAEELMVEPSLIRAFNILQKYHEQWREIGPVPREKKDELWERFKAVTSKINKNHQEFFEDRKSEQKTNLDAKTLLCEKAEEICVMALESHKDWDEKSAELIELQKVWRTIGFAPKKDNNRIYERFRKACDQFFSTKREFYSQNKEVQTNNLQMKTDLCIQAESLKDSTDWKKTADDFIEIQKKWKEIGPVPRKQSDIIWKRFRAACDYFFEHKAKHFSSIDGEQTNNLKLKLGLIEEVKAFVLTGDESSDLERLKDYQRKFTEIGHVPFRDKDKVQNDFRDAINIHFDSLRIDDKKRNMLKFRNKVTNLNVTNRGQNKMHFEREKYMTKLKQMESDLALLDNNIGFFANTKNAESLIGDVNQKIVNTKEKIEFLKEKIRILDAMEDGDE